ncbi:hypothetical protein CMUS01_05669 [Colletotrichum musicola]|uniref:Uncharacterized protein n=1 Tax=Colletotrichum musicola TaxID=2175873 RepID=A0A8H6KQA1_9PEZI|nr:hypothetical protein CMUS01_05669 [Colletotrichum musicola]
MDEESHIATVGPRSFLFFVVADVGPPGPGGRHRPLAVTYRQGRGHGPSRSMNTACRRIRQVVQDVARAVDIFSSPANRTAIEAERSLAAAEYRRPGRPEPARVEVPDLPQPSLADDMFHGKPQDVEQPGERPPSSLPRVDEWVREYPFISSCLRLALIRADDEEEDGAAGIDDVQERPLATVFREDALEYGAVVIDVSDLDDVRYGIVGSKIHYVAATGAGFAGTMGWDFTESYYHGPPPRLFLDYSGSRTPLSGEAYVDNFCVGRLKGRLEEWPALQRLERHHVVDRQTLGYIWPTALRTSSGGDGNPIPGVIDNDVVVQKFVSDILSSETFDIEARRDTINLHGPNFQDRLRACLLRDPERLRPSEASTQLLRLAYASCRHLDWTTYRNLSYEHIATTLLGPAHFDNARALSICVDENNGSSAPLLEAVQQREMIRDICFLEGPSRTSDGKSLDIFLQVCASPFALDLLGSRNFFVTCAFSAPLLRHAWLRDLATGDRVDSPALHKAFPVQHMFVRQQFVPREEVEPQDIMDYDQEEEEEKQREREKRGEVEEEEPEADMVFRPCHFYVGDALLKPKRFVSGFLQYCRWILDDRHLVSFAATPSSPSLPRSMDAQVGPIPAENLAGEVPFGFLGPGDWVVVVSHEWRTTQRIRKERRLHMSWGYPADWLIGVPIVRYAFLRATQRIVLPNSAGPELEQLAGPDFVDVAGGVKEFLQETGVHWKLVNEQLEETKRLLRERWRPGEGPAEDLPADMKLLEVLNEAEARIVFKDFLADAAGVRNDAMFRSLEESDTAGGARPLGSQRRLEPPEVKLSGYRPLSDEGTSWLYEPPTMV